MSFSTVQEAERERILKFNSVELDRRLGGIPIPSLNLFEGVNDSGKSVMAQQLTHSALQSGFRVLYITTEDTPKGLISHMASLNWDVTDYFIKGDFQITSIHVKGVRWSQELAKFYLIGLQNYLKRKANRFDIFVIDSLTHIITYAQERDILEFFSECRSLTDMDDRTFLIIIHPYAFSQEMLIRIRSMCDGHFLFSIKKFRDKNVLVLEVGKLKGAAMKSGNIVSFEVDPNFGIKVLPFSSARA